jgi:hypothetical protein
VSPVRNDEAAELGARLRAAGFNPLPDVNSRGELVGTRLWRIRAGYVEYVALRADGVGHAVRAEALYDYSRPFDHGEIVGNHVSYVTAAVDWLLHSSPELEPETERDSPQTRQYPDAQPHQTHGRDDLGETPDV